MRAFYKSAITSPKTPLLNASSNLYPLDLSSNNRRRSGNAIIQTAI